MSAPTINLPPLVSQQTLPLFFEPKNTELDSILEYSKTVLIHFDELNHSEKLIVKAKLNQIFQEIQHSNPHETSPLLILPLHLYGRCLYGGDMEQSKKMLQFSLYLHLQQQGLFDENLLPPLSACNHFDDVLKMLESHSHVFQMADEQLMKIPEDVLVANEKLETAFLAAMTYRWLGATYQNLEAYQSREHLPLFQKLYGVSKKLLEKLDTVDSRWLAGQITYNTARFLLSLERGYSHYTSLAEANQALATLKPLYALVASENKSPRSQVLVAQMNNISAVELGKIQTDNKEMKRGIANMQSRFLANAIHVADNAANFDPFLKIMFMNNRIAHIIKCTKEQLSTETTLESLEGDLNTVLTTIKEQDYNHYYHASFLLNAAEFEMLRKNPEAAVKHLNKAQEVADKFPGSTKQIATKIEQTRLEL